MRIPLPATPAALAFIVLVALTTLPHATANAAPQPSVIPQSISPGLGSLGGWWPGCWHWLLPAWL